MELSCSYVALFAKRQSFELFSTDRSLDTEDATAHIYKQIDAAWAFRSRRLQEKNFLRYTFSRQGSNVWSGEPGQGTRPGAILGIEFDVHNEYFLALPEFVDRFVVLFDNACKETGDFPFFLSATHEYQPRFGLFRDIDPTAVLKWLNNALRTADEKLYRFSSLKLGYPQHVETKKDVFYTCSTIPALLLSHFYSHSSIEIRATPLQFVAKRELPLISQKTAEGSGSVARSGRKEDEAGSKFAPFNSMMILMFMVVCILLFCILWLLYEQSKRLVSLENQIRAGIEYSKKPAEEVGNPDSSKMNNVPGLVETGAPEQIKESGRVAKGEPVSSPKRSHSKSTTTQITNDVNKVKK